MNWQEVKNIEATYLDYKLSLEIEKPVSWLKSVVAFANTKGGHIVFGVTDDTHKFVGIDDPQKTSTKISELISARIDPQPRFEIRPINSGDKIGIDLEVTDSPNYPYYYVNKQDRKIYIRHGDRSERATAVEQNNLLLKGINKTFDALPTSYKLSDVSFTLLAATFKKETGDDFDLSRDLISMGFITEKNIVTNAGLLLCDQGYLPQSKIVCTRWKGIEKGSIEGDALDDEEFEDASLITLLSNAEAFIRTNSKNPWTIRGMRREENSDYPFKAVREVLVNALIHRDYQIQGSEVHIDMFDDRMEIVSPGGMMNGSRIQDLNLQHVPSMRRNEIISDIFGRLHYMDRRGSGIQRILNSYKGLIEQPDFYSDSTVFLVTLPNRSVATLVENKELNEQNSTLQSKDSTLQGKNSTLQVQNSTLQYNKIRLSNEIDDHLILEAWDNKGINKIFQEKTISKIMDFYKKYGTQYSFNREAVANSFNIKSSYASRIIRKCCQINIMRKEKRGVYFFVI